MVLARVSGDDSMVLRLHTSQQVRSVCTDGCQQGAYSVPLGAGSGEQPTTTHTTEDNTRVHQL